MRTNMKSNTIYLMATYYKVPARRSATSKKNFGLDPNNFKYDEQVTVSQVLKNRDLTNCQVILDMGAKRVVKSSMSPGLDFDHLYQYFKENYPKYIELIEQGLGQNNNQENPENTQTSGE